MVALILLAGCTNETVINRGGTMQPGYEDLRFAPESLGKNLNQPDPVTFIGNTIVYAFDDTTDQQLYLSMQIPHAWLEGSTIYPHFHYSPLTNNSGVVVWCFEYVWSNYEEKYNTTSTTLCTSDEIDKEQYWHKMTPFLNITDGQKTASSMIQARIYRDANAPADNFTGDVGLLEFDIHYLAYRLGEPY